jgi:hypothetical protein
MLALYSKGFKVTEHPAKGIAGLICGDQHIPSKAVVSHLKYKTAMKNEVPIITIDKLPEIFGGPFLEDMVKL